MKNNIVQFRHDLEEYNKKSIVGGYFDKWKFKYLQERLNSEVLKDRLRNCKHDNNLLKKQYIDVINFLAHDPEGKLNIRKKIDITWDLDSTISTLMIDYLTAFKKSHFGVPSSIYQKYNDDKKSNEEWCRRIDCMINAFKIMGEVSLIESEENKKIVEEGKKWFIEHFESLWI